jgi:hypothetical protein
MIKKSFFEIFVLFLVVIMFSAVVSDARLVNTNDCTDNKWYIGPNDRTVKTEYDMAIPILS